MIGQRSVDAQSKTTLDGTKLEENTHVHVEPISNGFRNCLWWNQRSSFERILVILCLLFLILCATLVIVNVIIQGRLRIAERIASGTCLSKECILAASRMLDKMDPTIEPCDNFYQFACGNYLSRNTVPDDHYLKSTIQTMQDDMYVTLKKLVEQPVTPNDTEAILKVKRLYTSCMNTSSIEDGSVKVLLELLTDYGIGEWPILNHKWNKSKVDLEWRLAMLHVHQVQPFFHTFVAPDDRNSSVYLLHVYSGSPILNTQYYLNSSDPDYIRYMLSYKNLIAETVRLLKASESVVKRDIEALLEFEVDFANISHEDPFDSMNETNPMDDDFVFNRVNISMLEEMIPEIKWGILLGYIFDYIGLSSEKMDLNIVLHCEKYLRHLVVLLERTSPRTVANYLTWRFVAKYLPYLDIHFRRLYYDFRREVPNLSEERTFFARWKECVNLVNDGFGMALASLYVKEEFGEDLENEVKSLITSLKQAFVGGIKQQNWLDPDTKILCEEKVMSMTTKLGYPRYILDPVQLDTDYSGLEISEEHFLDNILKMNRYEVIKELTKMTRTVDKERDWFVQPLVVNAFYEATGNAVIFPVGILRTPIFTPDRPKYLNYGMLGVVIGHEITHGFDNSGRKFDKVGNLTQWWSDEIVEKFKEQASCFVEQYSQLPIDIVGQNVNGNQTLDDNICDNSGLKQAYRAYKNYVSEYGEEPSLPGITYSNLQVFFLQYAQIWCEVLSKEANERYVKDNHSPGKYRANIPLINSPEFSAVFNCPSGTPMNPVKKCRLWG
ncbi:endothelin-converting enzyme 1-like isoform X2 [Argiope bruennichi]|uniref:endothelin-converting enzyme 1-like isoform X2 n=1 Tax=Argiope bruennichi TaxID=94029 RepID=UPI00249533F3|nr:endothelin-converting enzyme 1-like isoform X2 [Argiope bruennichi]